jgi:hypothetical protein
MRLQHSLRLGIGTLAVIASLGAASALTVGATSPSPSATPTPTPTSTATPTPTPTATTDPSAISGPATPSATPTPGPCQGSVAAALACIDQRAKTAVDDRESALGELAGDVKSSVDITAGDRATLLGQIDADETGLDALLVTIDNDTTVKQALADTETIVTGYRVYLLETPKVHLVIAADTEGSVESVISSTLPAIQAAINVSSSPNKAAAQAAFNDCSSQLAAAESASAGIVAAVIDLQPSGYPGSQSTLTSEAQNAKAARQDLLDCYTDLKDILKDLGA